MKFWISSKFWLEVSDRGSLPESDWGPCASEIRVSEFEIFLPPPPPLPIGAPSPARLSLCSLLRWSRSYISLQPMCRKQRVKATFGAFSRVFQWGALVEHFEFFSGKIGEKCPLFFTLFFTEKASEKLKIFAALFGLFQNFHLKNEKMVKIL
jgi:hypothetical protein